MYRGSVLKVADAVSFLENSIERYGLMKTGIMLNEILNLLRQHDPRTHDVLLLAWTVILYL